MNQKLKDINEVLLSLLGSSEYVQRWWVSPNANWNLMCPQQIWDSGDQDEVWNYVMTHGYR